MNNEELAVRSFEPEQFQCPVIEFDPNLIVDFDDISDLDFHHDSSSLQEVKA